MELQFPGGHLMEVGTDGSWRCAKQEVEAWAGVCAEDSSWTNARVVGCHGDSPWKQLDSSSNEDVHGPQSTGIPGVVRMIYVPLADAVVVRELGAQAAYSGVCFDPVS